jgi:hypothetical protein
MSCFLSLTLAHRDRSLAVAEDEGLAVNFNRSCTPTGLRAGAAQLPFPVTVLLSAGRAPLAKFDPNERLVARRGHAVMVSE